MPINAGKTTVQGSRRAAGLADGAFALLAVLMVLAVAMLVGGEVTDAVFVHAYEDGGVFLEPIVTIQDNAETAFTIFSVGLLVIPAVAVISYLWSELGGLFGSAYR